MTSAVSESHSHAAPEGKAIGVEMRISLGNLLTILGMALGFLGVIYSQGQSSQSQTSDIKGLKDSFTELKGDIKDLTGSVSSEQITMTRFDDWKQGVETHLGQVEDHLKAIDSSKDGLKSEIQSLESALTVINGELKKTGR